MIDWRISRLPPSGASIGLGSLWRACRTEDAALSAVTALRRQLGVEAVSLLASGREALRVGLRHLAGRSGRREVVLPAYACFSVPSAVVAAGLAVRLVDVDDCAQIDLSDLAASPLDAAAAVVVCNLFGVPEPVAPVEEIAGSAGAGVVDDAAQSLGARAADGAVGARGEAGVLSFGRGKPISALGGGAIVWPNAPADLPPEPVVPEPGRTGALVRALAFETALWPPAFRVLAAIPQLRIGESRFDPDFPHGPIPAAALALLAALLPRAAEEGRDRSARARELAARIAQIPGWRPLLPRDGEQAVHPRLAVVAPSAGARDAALRGLTRLGAGASPMYPGSLDALPALRPHLVQARACPAARDFAARVLTLPTHGGLRGSRLERALEVLGRAGSGA